MRSVGYIRVLLPLAAALGLAACGHTDEQRTPGPGDSGKPGEQLVASPQGRTVVAEVDGVPIYEDCVAIQAAAHGLDRRAALGECIDFELLAQEAARRGLARDPEVRWTHKAEVVRRLTDTEFASRFSGPDSMDPAVLETLYARLRQRYVRPEERTTAHVWVPVDKSELLGSPRDMEAKALAREIHAGLAAALGVAPGEVRGLSAQEFFRLTKEAAGDRPLQQSGPIALRRYGQVAETYSEATFAIPEPGMVSAPVRAPDGWYIILLIRIAPEVNMSLEQAKPELFEHQRRQQYVNWVAQLARGMSIWVDENKLAELQAAEELERFPGGGTSLTGP